MYNSDQALMVFISLLVSYLKDFNHCLFSMPILKNNFKLNKLKNEIIVSSISSMEKKRKPKLSI